MIMSLFGFHSWIFKKRWSIYGYVGANVASIIDLCDFIRSEKFLTY